MFGKDIQVTHYDPEGVFEKIRESVGVAMLSLLSSGLS